ncbi:hypothetical protein DNTS_024851 [Danionella cerebrum]|uniref:Uncharacterized protein n=1 Tax=Danionella cerebrum TaxID=2873325 RepID=A0A553QS26_9TELE|nr:hypothetical protein DNTS_024851 [Danionella translucida]
MLSRPCSRLHAASEDSLFTIFNINTMQFVAITLFAVSISKPQENSKAPHTITPGEQNLIILIPECLTFSSQEHINNLSLQCRHLHFQRVKPPRPQQQDTVSPGAYLQCTSGKRQGYTLDRLIYARHMENRFAHLREDLADLLQVIRV